MINQILIFIKKIFDIKLKFSTPSKNEVLVWDFHSKELANKIFYENKITYLATRKEEINFFILMKMIFKGRFSKISYFVEFIKFVNPKIVITFIDNNPIFYELRNYINIPTISVQSGNRNSFNDVFGILEKLNHQILKNYKVDLMFVWNKQVGEKYKKFFDTNYIVSGSVLSNSMVKKNLKKDNCLIYISNFRTMHLKKNDFACKNITWSEFLKDEVELLNYLYIFCKEKKLKLKILGKYLNTELDKKFELEYFKKIINGENWDIIENNKDRNTYEIIAGTNSSLLFESLGRGNKTIFYTVRPNVYPINTQTFGYLSNKPFKGPFWINKLDAKYFGEMTNKVNDLSQIEWNNLINPYLDDIVKFDPNNSIIKKRLKEFVVNAIK